MKPIDRRFARLLAALCLFLLSTPPAAARQDPQEPQPPAVQAPAAFSAAEIRRLLDAYTVMQAQEFLGLTDTQFAQFLPRLKVIQDTRRRQQQARNKLVQELNRMSAPKAVQVPEGELRDRLRSLQELEIRSVSELQSAYETLDQVLTVRQQARFRVFEEQMERRQLELLMRARAAGGALGRAQRPAARPR